MKNYLLIKKLLFKSREYIFIILTATILLLISFSKSFSEENIFTVDNVEVEGKIDLNFSRDKFINKAFSKSFEELMAKIVLSRDLEKIKNIRLDKIKNLIKSFQIQSKMKEKRRIKGTVEMLVEMTASEADDEEGHSRCEPGGMGRPRSCMFMFCLSTGIEISCTT